MHENVFKKPKNSRNETDTVDYSTDSNRQYDQLSPEPKNTVRLYQ